LHLLFILEEVLQPGDVQKNSDRSPPQQVLKWHLYWLGGQQTPPVLGTFPSASGFIELGGLLPQYSAHVGL
jgi:hypothetical protein